jgi:5'-nucleotidase
MASGNGVTKRAPWRGRRKPRILISNDDGVYSPGLSALADVAVTLGDVKIYAPDVDRASAGHSLSANRPISWKATRLSVEAYRVDGTPADCVALGFAQWKGIDVALAGINLGTNLDNRIWNSSTVAAAKEAALLGSRGISLSMAVPALEPDYDALKPILRRVLELLLPLADVPLLNVNFPSGRVKGFRWTREAVCEYRSEVRPNRDPDGRRHSWFSVARCTEPSEDSDIWAIEHGYVSITPVRIDLTDEPVLVRCQDTLPSASDPKRHISSSSRHRIARTTVTKERERR